MASIPNGYPTRRSFRDGWAAEGRASYEVFIRTLLSVTDDLAGESVTHPSAW
ncbi:MAG: NAD-glutamate dehydrogenase [Altererythrobacter sp.]